MAGTSARSTTRHARPCAGHPRPCSPHQSTWMAGTSPAMTNHGRDGAKFQTANPGTHLRVLAARCVRVLRQLPSTERAQGMPGARCTRGLACKNKKAHEVVTTGSPEQSGIPRARENKNSCVVECSRVESASY